VAITSKINVSPASALERKTHSRRFYNSVDHYRQRDVLRMLEVVVRLDFA